MQINDLNVLASFLAVAQERSFTRAAKRVGVSRSALSHSVRGLEERLGVRLLARTTRSVARTDAGQRLIDRLGPALGDVNSVMDQIAGLSGRPSGPVRVIASRLAARMILAPKMAQFAREHPDVVLDVTTSEESRVDLVREGFDAGIHLGEFVERDMVAVRVSREQRAAIVGAPAYFATHPAPAVPRDLTAHKCLNFRHGSSGVYRWELENGQQSVAVAVSGPIIVDDVDVMLRAAVDGAGLAFALEEHVAQHLADGELVRVLTDWCPPFAGYFLYYPSRRQQRAAVAALIDALRL